MSLDKPKLLVLDSPWSFDPGTVRLEAPSGLTADDVSRLLLSGELNKPYIFENRTERSLHFTHFAVQSRMLLTDPDALANDYTRKMMAFLLFNPAPEHIFMIGLGGGSLPKFCHRHLPESRITVVEINADVIALRDEFCIPPDSGRFRVVHADGAKYISQLRSPVDVILIDAFDPGGVTPALAKSGFYERAAAVLAPAGILVMNLSGQRDRFDAHIRRILDAFDGTVVVVPVDAGHNELLFAFKEPILLELTPEYRARARLLESRLSLAFPKYLRRIMNARALA